MIMRTILMAAVPYICIPFFYCSAIASTFDEALIAYKGSKYEAALTDFILLAKKGNPEAAYMAGKIYMEGKLDTKLNTPDAVYWLLIADMQGSSKALEFLQEYSRRGYRLFIFAVETRLKDALGRYKRGQKTSEFPLEVLEEIRLYWHALYSDQSPNEARSLALEELSLKADVDICREAISIKLTGWDSSYRSAGAVEEASRRNISIGKCRDILTLAVTPP